MLLEQEHYRGLINCFDLHDQWTAQFLKRPLIRYLDLIRSESNVDYVNWISAIKEITQTTTENILDVLRCTTFSNTIESETNEYNLIRGIYVPYLVMTTYQINYKIHQVCPERLQRCFELAEMVANVGIFDYCEPFLQSGKMGVFLGSMREAALASLSTHQGTLPWFSKV